MEKLPAFMSAISRFLCKHKRKISLLNTQIIFAKEKFFL